MESKGDRDGGWQGWRVRGLGMEDDKDEDGGQMGQGWRMTGQGMEDEGNRDGG